MSERTATAKAAIGSTGLTRYGGHVAEEWDRRLQSGRGLKAYREMSDGSPIVGAALRAWESLVIATGWRIDPSDDTPQAKELATFVEECIDDLTGSFAETLSEIFTFRPYGFALFETLYKVRSAASGSKYDDGRIGWDRWSPRAQETILEWVFDDVTGDATKAVQSAPPKYARVEIPLDRCLHFVARRRKGSPEGTSVLRNAYEPWYYLKNIMRIEAIGIERDLAGLPVVWVPVDVLNSASERADWDALGTNIRRDEQASVTMPLEYDDKGNKTYDLTLLTSGGARQIDTEPIIVRYQTWMLRSLLADWLTQGDTGVGSYAQSVNRTSIFMRSVKGECQPVEDVINTAIRKLFAVNGLPLELTPKFAFNELSQRDLKEFADSLVALVNAGLVDASDADVGAMVYDMLGLPRADQTEEQVDEEQGQTVNDQQDQEREPPTEPEDEPVPPTQPRQASEPAPVWEDELDITDAYLQEIKDKWDKEVPQAAGLLDAKVVGE